MKMSLRFIYFTFI